MPLLRRLAIGVLAVALGTVSATGSAGDASAQARDSVKVGFVYVGPVSDHGWSYRHDVGRRAIEAALGGRVSTSYVESVNEGPDAERVIRQLAQSGHDLIFTTSFGFMNPTLRVAARFPDVKFEHATGYRRAENVATYDARFYEGRAVIGAMAGRLTTSGVVGYIASIPIPEVMQGINAFTLALRRERPDATVKVVWTNGWYDPGKEADAAKTLIDQGADILAQHTDSPAALQVAEQRGVHAFGQSSDMRTFAPKAQLTAIVDNWDAYYIERTQAVLDGTWESQAVWGGFDSGLVELAPYGPGVPEDVAAMADAFIADLKAGRRHAFDGPVRRQDGSLAAAEGEHLPDDDLVKMDWYVEGVEGRPPG